MKNTTEASTKEKRRHERVPLCITMNIAAGGQEVTRCRGTISDLSMGGMTFKTNAELEAGMVLHLKLDQALEIRGEVTSIKGSAAGGMHRYGIRFHKIGYPSQASAKAQLFIAAKFQQN